MIGVATTRAIQRHGVIAMAKHFVLNDTEIERFRTRVEISEQALRELYLIPFEMAVKDGGVIALMSAYNRARGTYATENRYLLTDILRGEWGFTGYVQSEFWSTRSAAASIHTGLDLEMPDAKWLNEEHLTAALQDTSLEIQAVDRALIRRFTRMFRLGQFERPFDPGTVDAATHGAWARAIGRQLAVLLKNDGGALPVDPSSGRILVVGQQTYAGQACLGGGGSSRAQPLYTVDPVPGLREVIAELGGAAEVELKLVDEDLSTAGRPERYPCTDEGDGYPTMRYSEGLRMGYRWYQSAGSGAE